MLGMSVSSHTSISFGTGGDLYVMYMSQKNKVMFYMTRIFSDEFIISDMANDYTKYIAILSVILQIVKIFMS